MKIETFMHIHYLQPAPKKKKHTQFSEEFTECGRDGKKISLEFSIINRQIGGRDVASA
jgi:hypothetical protein